MLTYRSFVISFAVSSLINQSIQVLLQLIIKGLFSLNVITLNSLLMKIASFAVCDRANNLASVLNVVTISCLFTLQAIGPLNSFIIYPYKLFLLIELSVNNASLVQINVTDHRHCVEIVTWKAPRQPPYILTCRSILPADHCSHFSYLLPHYISTFFVYIQSLQSYIHNQVARSILPHCIVTTTIPAYLSRYPQ